MGSSCYDIGLPMDLQESIAKLADRLDAKVPEVAHALMRESLSRLTNGHSGISGEEYTAAVKSWWKTVGEGKKK